MSVGLKPLELSSIGAGSATSWASSRPFDVAPSCSEGTAGNASGGSDLHRRHQSCHNGKITHAPTLVLDGDIDNRVPYDETNEVAELFPNSTNVIVAEAGHETIGWTQCARNLVAQFIENLQPGDTSCAIAPETVWPAVGRFPLPVKDARPAEIDSSGNNQIGVGERKTVSVAMTTAIDALQRSLIGGSGTGVGLWGGTFETVLFGATSIATSTLTHCSFSRDLIVNGTLTWGFDNSIVADLTVSGPGTAGESSHHWVLAEPRTCRQVQRHGHTRLQASSRARAGSLSQRPKSQTTEQLGVFVIT